MKNTKTIDYVFRFDPTNPTSKPMPRDATRARTALEDGNRMFSRWMERCRSNSFSTDDPHYVVPCNVYEVGMVGTRAAMPKPSPFAVVVGCSDARVPTEMLFGQGFNDLFVIRVAGNVLGDECLGSIDFALHSLSESVKILVMLGHSNCGAVTGAVDAYLQPHKFWSKSTSPNLRNILQRIFVAVREAANGFETVWGADARSKPGFRDALIESAVCINAAQSAYNLHLEVERSGKWEIEVLYGVYDLFTHRVNTPRETTSDVQLAFAPTNPRDFQTLAIQIAESLRPLADVAPVERPSPIDNWELPQADGHH